jgi:dipeptidyl aminopeptidase/acylaminoacyl peptidase
MNYRIISYSLLLAIFLVLAGTLQMVAQHRLTAERMLEIGRVGSPVVSPDGSYVLYTVTRMDTESNSGSTTIWIQSRTGGEARELVAGSSPIWRPDGERVGFMRGGQLWEISPTGGEPVQVTDIQGGVGFVQYAPDGQHISFTRNVALGETAASLHPDLPKAEARVFDELMYRHWDTWYDGTYRHLHLATYNNGRITGEPVNLMEGERYDTPLKPFGGSSQIAWRPDGGAIVYTSKKLHGTDAAWSTDSDLYLYELSTGVTVNLTEGMHGYDFYPTFSPDGSHLAWLSMETPMYEADRYRLMLRDMASGQITELSAGFDQNVNGQRWSADGNTIYFLSGIEATVQLFACDFATASNSCTIRRITDGVHDFTGFDLAETSSDTEIIATRMSMSAPVELFRVNPVTGNQTPFSNVNQTLLASTDMGRVEQRWVTTTDNKQMLVWVIFPPDFDPNKQYPTLLYAQGGPQGTVSQFFSYRWNFQVMAANGYIVVAPNRRGLPSFGQDWNLQISGDWGGQAMQDLLSAIDHVSEEPFVDSDRLGMVGASFGGYSVFWMAGNHNGRFSTFISHAGVFHLESMYGETEEMFFVHHDLGGAFWETPRPVSYDLHSPHTYVSNWDTPILMIHGELDYRVPLGQSMQAFTAAQRLGIPSRFLIFPHENHWILSPQNSLLWHREFFGWLDRWLK